MKIGNAFPSKYLKAGDLQDRPYTLTMNRVELERIADDEKKPVLYFEQTQKGLVLNKVNSNTIKAAYGEETDDWEGKPVVLFPAMVDFRGEQVEAIRVRVPKPAKSSSAAASRSPARPLATEDDPRTMLHESENPGAGLDDSDIPF